MADSPYTPPRSKLTDEPSLNDDSGLPDLSQHSNDELRELLFNPDFYTPNSVHAAAKELASRHAVPRYHTHIRSRVLNRVIQVRRNGQFDIFTRIRLIFSDTRIQFWCLSIAILQSLAFANQLFNFIPVIKMASADYMKNNPKFFISSTLGILYTGAMACFFITLYCNLSIRTIKRH